VSSRLKTSFSVSADDRGDSDTVLELRVPPPQVGCRAAEALDLARDAGVVGPQRRPDVLRIGAIRSRREADQVDEEHGDDLPLFGTWSELRERGAAGEAEASPLGVLLGAVRADRHGPSVRSRRRVVPVASHVRGYGRCMEEARAVLARLRRIEALDRGGTPAELLLAELRALVDEAETWVRAEPVSDPAMGDAIERLRAALTVGPPP